MSLLPVAGMLWYQLAEIYFVSVFIVIVIVVVECDDVGGGQWDGKAIAWKNLTNDVHVFDTGMPPPHPFLSDHYQFFFCRNPRMEEAKHQRFTSHDTTQHAMYPSNTNHTRRECNCLFSVVKGEHLTAAHLLLCLRMGIISL